jgi:hypothetical protein
MELALMFRSGSIRGDGLDWIGKFTIKGGYDVKDGRCWWTKHYIGQHNVSYAGYNEGNGIWGVWDIGRSFRRGFHSWPSGMGDPTAARVTDAAERSAPAEAIGGRTEPAGGQLQSIRVHESNWDNFCFNLAANADHHPAPSSRAGTNQRQKSSSRLPVRVEARICRMRANVASSSRLYPASRLLTW